MKNRLWPTAALVLALAVLVSQPAVARYLNAFFIAFIEVTIPEADKVDGRALKYDTSEGVGKFKLEEDSTGVGDVAGPASSTDNAAVRFDGATGKLIQDGPVLISDTGAVSGVTTLVGSSSVTGSSVGSSAASEQVPAINVTSQAEGDLLVRDQLPSDPGTLGWVRRAIGSANTFLASNGTDRTDMALGDITTNVTADRLGADTADEQALSLNITSQARGDLILRGPLPSDPGTMGWIRKAVGSARQTLLSDGTDPSWATVYPASSTDNALTRWDGTGGTVTQNSGAILDDSNNISGLGTISSGAITSTGSVTGTALGASSANEQALSLNITSQARGDLILRDFLPSDPGTLGWIRKAIGASGTILNSDGSTLVYTALGGHVTGAPGSTVVGDFDLGGDVLNDFPVYDGADYNRMPLGGITTGVTATALGVSSAGEQSLALNITSQARGDSLVRGPLPSDPGTMGWIRKAIGSARQHPQSDGTDWAWTTIFPASSTDNALTRWDGAGGTVTQNSGAILDDSNNLSGLGTIASGAITSTGNVTGTTLGASSSNEQALSLNITSQARGDLILRGQLPSDPGTTGWVRKALGASNTFLISDGTDLIYMALSAITSPVTATTLGQSTAEVNANSINLSSQAQGDLFWFDSRVGWTRLPIGSTGQVLKVQAGSSLAYAADDTGSGATTLNAKGQVQGHDGAANANIAAGADRTVLMALASDAEGALFQAVFPASATDNAISRWDGTSGTLTQDSGVIIDDSNNITGVAGLTATGSVTGSALGASSAAEQSLALNITSQARGDIIVRGPLPSDSGTMGWVRKAAGAANTFLTSDGTDRVDMALGNITTDVTSDHLGADTANEQSFALNITSQARGDLVLRGQLPSDPGTTGWVRKALGAANSALVSDGTDLAYMALGAITTPVTATTLGASTATSHAGAINLTSQALGDLLTYQTGSGNNGWARLAAGTTGQVLTMQASGLPGWAAAAGGGGAVKQIQTVNTVTEASTTTIIPYDDTIPQNTEGAELFTLSVTPTSATSTLLISFVLYGESSSAAGITVMAVFVDSTADALYAAAEDHNAIGLLSGSFTVASASTSARTYKLRYGPDAAGTVYVNSDGGAARFSTAGMVSIMTIVEYEN